MFQRWEKVSLDFGYIYIYDARKISLDLDEFSIKKKSIDVIQNSNPAKSEERESFRFLPRRGG